MNLTGLTGIKYRLDNAAFSGGGEGDIYQINGMSDKCAKIYHTNSRLRETESKLKVMVANPPNASVLSQIAWPLDVLYSEQNEFVGFVMPKIQVSDELIAVYEYPPTKYQRLTFEQKLIVAQNICAVIDGVHNAGFVFGDFNPNNIGVDMNTGHVAFWDTDSYHIKDSETGVTYRCKVCLDGYVAPELIEKCKYTNPKTGKNYNYEDAPLETFTKETDNFALAIHIFRLLMNGFTPFAGIAANQQLNSTIAPGVGNAAIEQDQYCFKPGNIHLSKAVPDKSVLPNEIISLFDRAFIDGRNNPSLRPTAREWHQAIERFSNQLEQCKNNPVHQYMKGLAKCPWCEIDKIFNVGLQNAKNKYISTAQNNIQGVHIQPTLTYNSGINTSNQNQIKSKKSIMIAEVIVLVAAILSVFIFFLYDSHRWKNKLRPEAYKEYGTTVDDWTGNKLIYTGSLNSENTEDQYTFTLSKKSGGYSNGGYKIEFDGVASNNQTVEIKVENTKGENKTFNLGDSNEWLDEGYDITLASGGTYKVTVKCVSGDADYVLTMVKDR